MWKKLVSATAANPGEAADTGPFSTWYNNEIMVVVRDVSGTATGTETMSVSITNE